MSDGFSTAWLDLRERFDAAARNISLLARLAAWRGDRRRLQVIDLGAGTGANLRRTAPALGGAQSWTLVERDAGLVRAGSARLEGHGAAWTYRQLDLALELEALGDGPCDLLTASALLDLVSAEWLGRLARLRRQTGAALYVALTFDGRIEWEPVDSFDAQAIFLVNQHQRTDKGFGPALGPAAGGRLAQILAEEGERVEVGRSDWTLLEGDVEIQAALLDGHACAARQIAPAESTEIARWSDRRRELLRKRSSRLRVGHLDLLMLP